MIGSMSRGLIRRGVSVFLDVKGTAGANVLIMVVSFGASLLAARLLGPEHRGYLAAAVVYAALATAVGDVGLNQAVPYFAARRRDDAPTVIGTVCVLALITGTLAAVGAYALLSTSAAAPGATLVYLLSVPFGMITTHMAGYMYGGGMLTSFNAVRTCQAAVLLVALTAAATLGQHEVLAVALWAVLVSLCLAGASVFVMARCVPARQWRFDARVAKDLLGYAGRSYLGNLCWLFNSRLDQVMMSLLLPASALGIYATSVSYAGVVFSFFGAFAMLAFAKAAAVDPRDEAGVQAVLRHYIILALALGVPVAATLIVIAPWLFPLLFGPAFDAGVGPGMLLSAAGVVLGVNYLLSNGLRIRNKPLLPSLAEAMGVVVSVVGLWWALPRFGLTGAAVVSIMSYGTVLLTLLYFLRTSRGVVGVAPSAAGISS